MKRKLMPVTSVMNLRSVKKDSLYRQMTEQMQQRRNPFISGSMEKKNS